ncbi:hypothetical protein DPMN_132276 [Dreissena polymorpha]|uniref:Uncharacterized protein n=1 Tax=Dreissena polymorpha TaxID=45954 RepID=A0A9D4JCZ1_DREPO|nr:hypothetical protein DPMN_132276 [Dreissena polymorpha]
MEKLTAFWILPCVLMLTFLVGPSIQQTSPFISHACYGTDAACFFFHLNCSERSVIQLTKMFAGRKDATQCPSDDQCNKSLNCCNYNAEDTYVFLTMENAYNIYRHCSGRTDCSDINAPREVIDTNTGVMSSYVHMEYTCGSVTDKIPMCGGPSKKTTKVTNDIDIWFDGSTETFDPNSVSKECKCSFTNLLAHNLTDLVLYLIDVRLESHYNDVNASSAMCSSAILTNEGYLFHRCKESTEHWKNNFIYSKSDPSLRSITLLPGETTYVLLKDIHKTGPRDSPAMIWFRARVPWSNHDMTVTCEEVITTEFTNSLTTLTQQPAAADTTRADTVSSDGNLSTGAIVAISVGSGVAFTLLVVVVSFTLFRTLRTRKTKTAVELDFPVYPIIDDKNTASSHSKEHEVDLDGTVYQTIDDTHIASSHSNEREAQGYESLSRDGDHDNHAYLGVIPADSTVGELRDYETPDCPLYLDLEPRNGHANDVQRYENV